MELACILSVYSVKWGMCVYDIFVIQSGWHCQICVPFLSLHSIISGVVCLGVCMQISTQNYGVKWLVVLLTLT